MAHSTDTMRPNPSPALGYNTLQAMPVSSMNPSHSSGPGAVFMLPPTYLGTRFFIR